MRQVQGLLYILVGGLMKQHYLILGLTISIFSLLFQNCETRLSTFDDASKIKTTNSSQANNSQADTQSNIAASADKAIDTLKVTHQSSYAAQTDCSRADATLKSEVTNAGSDILVCSEYRLEMPTQSKRFGEFYKCDSPSKFVKPPSVWNYNLNDRKWSVDLAYLQNHAFIVPGDFTLVVMDNQGQVHRSSIAKIRKSGAENCLVTSSVNPPTTPSCRIQTATGELDFSPSLVGKSCSSNSDAAIVNSNGWYICKCN